MEGFLSEYSLSLLWETEYASPAVLAVGIGSESVGIVKTFPDNSNLGFHLVYFSMDHEVFLRKS